MNTLLERVQNSNLKLQRYLTLLESSSFNTNDGKLIEIVDGVASIEGKTLEPGKYQTGEQFIEIVEGGQVVSLPSSLVEDTQTPELKTQEIEEVTETVNEVIEVVEVESPELVELKAKVLELEALLVEKETNLEAQKMELEALVLETKKSEELIGKLTRKPVSPEKISMTQLGAESIEVVKTQTPKSKDVFAKQRDNVFN